MPHALSLEAIATIFCTTYPAGGTVLAATRVPRAYNYEVWRLDARHGRYALKVARLHVYRGMEYLAEVYRMTQRGEVARAPRFQTFLRRWLGTH